MPARLSRLLKFVPAIVAGATFAASAQAAVIYSDGPATAPTPSLTLALPNGDEIVFEVGPDGNSGWIATRVSANTARFTARGALGAGAPIGTTTAFVADDPALYRQGNGDKKSEDKINGPWADSPAGFLGFAFTGDEGHVHYGWIDLWIEGNGVLVSGWAYEDKAGVAIAAGAHQGGAPAPEPEGAAVNQLPEPDALVLLGIGALGLAAVGRRKAA